MAKNYSEKSPKMFQDFYSLSNNNLNNCLTIVFSAVNINLPITFCLVKNKRKC